MPCKNSITSSRYAVIAFFFNITEIVDHNITSKQKKEQNNYQYSKQETARSLLSFTEMREVVADWMILFSTGRTPCGNINMVFFKYSKYTGQ